MQPVYIDCHGLRQFSKILFALTNASMDKNDLSFSECVETNTKNNKSFPFFRIAIIASDPSLLHQFLMDNLSLPSQFIWYDNPADHESENTMIDHSGIQGINLYCLLYNIALISCFLTNIVRNKIDLMRGGIPDYLRARSCGFISYEFNRSINIEYFPMWIDTSIEDKEPLIINWY